MEGKGRKSYPSDLTDEQWEEIAPLYRGMLTINALSAADEVLIPMQARYLSRKGMEQLMRTIARLEEDLEDEAEEQYRPAPSNPQTSMEQWTEVGEDGNPPF